MQSYILVMIHVEHNWGREKRMITIFEKKDVINTIKYIVFTLKVVGLPWENNVSLGKLTKQLQHHHLARDCS